MLLCAGMEATAGRNAGCFGGQLQKLYFFGMKRFTGLLLLIGLISCREQPASMGPRPKLVHPDSVRKDMTNNPYAPVDVSPMDMSYLPVDFPKLSVRKTLPIARVIYSRPHKQGRKIFGNLVPYGQPWRLGANEATEIEFFQPVTIRGKSINRGKYILYCIPYKDKWTIVFNTKLFTWGLEQDSTRDAYRFDASIEMLKNQTIEYFSIVFQQKPKGADLVMAWDDVEGRLSIEYSEE
jgi:hypothetical protein